MIIPVEQVVAGDVVVLPGGREVTVTENSFDPDDSTYTVGWWRPAEFGEPGYPRENAFQGDHNDGRYLGSLRTMRAGDPVTIVDRDALRRTA